MQNARLKFQDRKRQFQIRKHKIRFQIGSLNFGMVIFKTSNGRGEVRMEARNVSTEFSTTQEQALGVAIITTLRGRRIKND